MATIEEYGEQHPEMLAFLQWVVETERNIEGLIEKLTDPAIVSYISNGTTAIRADLIEAHVKMEKAIEHAKTAIERAEVDIAIREAIGGKDANQNK